MWSRTGLVTGRVRKQNTMLVGAEEPEEGHGVKERAYGKRKGRWLFCMCFSYIYIITLE